MIFIDYQVINDSGYIFTETRNNKFFIQKQDKNKKGNYRQIKNKNVLI